MKQQLSAKSLLNQAQTKDKKGGSVRVQITVRVAKNKKDKPTTKAQLDAYVNTWVHKGKLPDGVEIKAVAWYHGYKRSEVNTEHEMEEVRKRMLSRFWYAGMRFQSIRAS